MREKYISFGNWIRQQDDLIRVEDLVDKYMDRIGPPTHGIYFHQHDDGRWSFEYVSDEHWIGSGMYSTKEEAEKMFEKQKEIFSSHPPGFYILSTK